MIKNEIKYSFALYKTIYFLIDNWWQSLIRVIINEPVGQSINKNKN